MLNKKNKNLKIFIILSIIGILLRVLWLNGESGDYKGFLALWVDDIRRLGYFKSLKYSIGNYNVPYMIILTFISLLKCKPLIPIKIISIIFDFICAYYSSKIVYLITKNNTLKLVIYGIVLCLPSVIVNSSMWGQCDSIYTAFILISLYYLLNKKYTLSFIMLGISLSFKLQAIFVLPVYILLFFREKKIHLYHFLLIPIMDIVLSLPAIIMGKSIKDIFLVYFNQTDYYIDAVLNFPNLYNYIQENTLFFITNHKLISTIGVILTAFIFFIMWVYILINKVKFNNEKIITLFLWSILICVFFLPHMHDRYMFSADILSIVWFIIYQKKVFIPFIINISSTLTYFYFLFLYNIVDYKILSIILLFTIISLTLYTMKLLKELNNQYN